MLLVKNGVELEIFFMTNPFNIILDYKVSCLFIPQGLYFISSLLL